MTINIVNDQELELKLLWRLGILVAFCPHVVFVTFVFSMVVFFLEFLGLLCAWGCSLGHWHTVLAFACASTSASTLPMLSLTFVSEAYSIQSVVLLSDM